jgi:hypothetical protein
MLHKDLELFESHDPLSASELLHIAFDYIPQTLRCEIYKAFYIGFYTIFRATCNVLATLNILTPGMVVTEALALNAEAVQFYMAKGGKVEYVLDAMVAMAREQSSLGAGTFEETFDHDEGDEEGVGAKYRALGECSNDLEFGIVRRKIGLVPTIRWGPYKDTEEGDEGMEVDEDEDKDEDDDDSDW